MVNKYLKEKEWIVIHFYNSNGESLIENKSFQKRNTYLSVDSFKDKFNNIESYRNSEKTFNIKSKGVINKQKSEENYKEI